MRKFATLMFMLFLVLAVLLTSCNLPLPGALNNDVNSMATITALSGTLQAVLTSMPAGNVDQPLPSPGFTLVTVTGTPTNEAPLEPSLEPSTTVTPAPCDLATLVTDVTIPENTILLPDQVFTKTWRLKNAGSCTWNSTYSVVFDSGYNMSGPISFNLPGSVIPGQTVDLSITLRTPTQIGLYMAKWKLRNASGTKFGVGADGNGALSMRVIVVEPTNTWTPTSTITPTRTRTATRTKTPTATHKTRTPTPKKP